MLGQRAIERQLEILEKFNSADKFLVLCEDEIYDDHDDLLEQGLIAEVKNPTTFYGIISFFNPKALCITEKGKEVLLCQSK